VARTFEWSVTAIVVRYTAIHPFLGWENIMAIEFCSKYIILLFFFIRVCSEFKELNLSQEGTKPLNVYLR
jgi:hypothetical protein